MYHHLSALENALVEAGRILHAESATRRSPPPAGDGLVSSRVRPRARRIPGIRGCRNVASPMNEFPKGTDHVAGPGFRRHGLIRVPVAGGDLASYVHCRTGARHLHLAMPGEDSAFLVAVLTPAPDSSGLTHVLEHLAMCGSERYPCRRAFFAMMGRTLGAAMNAMTREDCTAFHFVTRSLDDYENLLSVYLDGVFFPRLDRRDFDREASHVEVQGGGGSNPTPVRRGVVLSEMRGEMADTEAQLQQAVNRALFPGSAYRFNAGGDPRQIPALDYDALLDYQRRHFHPGNAVFLSSGAVRAEWLQERLHEMVLARPWNRTASSPRIVLPPLAEPSRVVTHYPPVAEGADDRSGAGVALAWRLGDSADPLAQARARLLSRCLLEQGEAPLRVALEAPGSSGTALASAAVQETRSRIVFQCGAVECNRSDAERIGTRLRAALDGVAREGVPTSDVDAALAALERERCELHDPRYPLPLKLLVRLLPAALYGGEPAALLDSAGPLAALRDRIRSRADSAELVRRELRDNPEQVCVVALPDPASARRLEDEDRVRLERAAGRVQRKSKGRHSPRGGTCSTDTAAPDGESSLPRLGLESIGSPRARAPMVADSDGRRGIWTSRGPTGGLVYVRLAVELDGIAPEWLDDVGLLSAVLPDSGLAGENSVRARARVARLCDRLSVEPWLLAPGSHGTRDPAGAAPRPLLVLSARARGTDEAALIELLEDVHLAASFGPETPGVAGRCAARGASSLTRYGHLHAERVAAARLGIWGALDEHWKGPSAVRALSRAADSEHGAEALAARLQRVHRVLSTAPRQIQIVRDETHRRSPVRLRPARPAPESSFPPGGGNRCRRTAAPGAWIVGGGVNYCAKVFPVVGADHPDAGRLAVLAAHLGGEMLPRAIREIGGAYGAGARYCQRSATFRMFSYRDPRLSDTLRDFDRLLHDLVRKPPRGSSREEAILRAIRDLDRPRAFQVAAFERFLDELQGRDGGGAARLRDSVLRVHPDELLDTAKRYLRPERGRAGVLAAAGREAELDRLGLSWSRL